MDAPSAHMYVYNNIFFSYATPTKEEAVSAAEAAGEEGLGDQAEILKPQPFLARFAAVMCNVADCCEIFFSFFLHAACASLYMFVCLFVCMYVCVCVCRRRMPLRTRI